MAGTNNMYDRSSNQVMAAGAIAEMEFLMCKYLNNEIKVAVVSFIGHRGHT